mgnify:CR=1 FL=1
MDIKEEYMELKISSYIGSMNEDIGIEKEGKNMMIGFNLKFFIDALRVIDGFLFHTLKTASDRS